MPKFMNRTGSIRASMVLAALAGGAIAPVAVLAIGPGVRVVSLDAPAGGDGLTWATAYNNLQTALAAAGSSGGAINELWVKQGTYYPAALGSADRTVTFAIGDGLALYGGFAGTEAQRDERDPAAHVTTLNGDLGGIFKSVFHVVTMTSAVLDGVTVTGGSGAAPSPGNAGGGIYVTGSSQVRNCIVTNNFVIGYEHGALDPGRGGGVYAAPGAVLTMADTVIANNAGYVQRFSALYANGGGLAAEASTVHLVRCQITSNRATDGDGPGCMGGFATPRSAGGDGGGIYLYGAVASFEDCVIASNRAGKGASGYTCPSGSSTPSTQGGSGGGMYIIHDSTVNIVNCVFSGNAAGTGPASAPIYGAGGAIAIAGSGSAVWMVNSTTAGGTIDPKGAGVAVQCWDGAFTAANCIFWDADPTGGGVLSSTLSSMTVTYSDIRGGFPGAGNINADPLFVLPASGNYRLADISPCIDAANNTADADLLIPGLQPLPPTDLDGAARRVDSPVVADTGLGTAPIVDMGPYEHQNPTCAADLNGDGLVDFGDYLEFLNLYDSQDLHDFNGDGVVDFGDYLEFLNHYDAGC